MALAERKIEGIAAVLARIELAAVGQPAGVMDDDMVACLGLGACADNGVFVDQAGGRSDFSHEVLLLKGEKSTTTHDKALTWLHFCV